MYQGGGVERGGGGGGDCPGRHQALLCSIPFNIPITLQVGEAGGACGSVRVKNEPWRHAWPAAGCRLQIECHAAACLVSYQPFFFPVQHLEGVFLFCKSRRKKNPMTKDLGTGDRQPLYPIIWLLPASCQSFASKQEDEV